MTQWLSRSTRIGYILVILLVLATPVLVVWQHYGMTRTLEISPQHPYPVVVIDDRVAPRGNPAKGDSVASLSVTRDAFVMGCRMGTAAMYPYCAVQFLMGDPVKGIDMTGYDTISFDVRYSGPGRHVLKVHLMNFEPEFFTPGKWDAQRFNEVQIDVSGQSPFTIPMNALRTADWWHFARQVPLSKSYVRVDHVTTVELQADDLSAAGHSFTVEVRKMDIENPAAGLADGRMDRLRHAHPVAGPAALPVRPAREQDTPGTTGRDRPGAQGSRGGA
jgi:hypothetical protein